MTREERYAVKNALAAAVNELRRRFSPAHEAQVSFRYQIKETRTNTGVKPRPEKKRHCMLCGATFAFNGLRYICEKNGCRTKIERLGALAGR